MAAIVDTDVFHKILTRRDKKGDSAFRSWIESGRGILVYSPTGAYKRELEKNNAAMELMRTYRQAQHVKLIGCADLSEAKKQLSGNNFICSNDIHILALALAGGVLVLCSNDKDLGKDFRNKDVLPRIGRKSRVLYPIDATPKKRRQFLDKRNCRGPQ